MASLPISVHTKKVATSCFKHWKFHCEIAKGWQKAQLWRFHIPLQHSTNSNPCTCSDLICWTPWPNLGQLSSPPWNFYSNSRCSNVSQQNSEVFTLLEPPPDRLHDVLPGQGWFKSTRTKQTLQSHTFIPKNQYKDVWCPRVSQQILVQGGSASWAVPFAGIVSDITSFWLATTVQLTGHPPRDPVWCCQQKWQTSKGVFSFCLHVLQSSTDSQDSKEKLESVADAFDAKIYASRSGLISQFPICKRIKTPMAEGTKWPVGGHDSKRPERSSDIMPTWPLVEGLNGGMQYATCIYLFLWTLTWDMWYIANHIYIFYIYICQIVYMNASKYLHNIYIYIW